jgi:DNA mismatch endonuclease (patch repair protein)
MARIRGRETGPERILRRALGEAGLRGWRKNRRMIATVSSPDVAFTRWKVAVFVDGAFWHGHRRYFTPGKSGAYWDQKIANNRKRDRRTTRTFRRQGWHVVRVWDFDVEKNAPAIAERIAAAVQSRRERSIA